jgi:hypothetical protein
MVQPYTSRYVPADILTIHHYIFGQLKVHQSGLMGMLSDTTSSYVEVDDASMAMIHKSDKVINYTPMLWMVKSQVVVVCLNKRDYVGLQGILRGGYGRLQPYPVQVTTSSYDISGTLEWSGRFEFSSLISEGTNPFFMLTDTVVTAPLFPALHIESPVALVNRNFLETFMLVKKSDEG